MNPSVNSTDEHEDPSWPTESCWVHPVASVCCGLDPRQIQPNRLDWDWEGPMILAQHSHPCAGDQETDCKPNIMADAIGASLRQYSGVLPTSFPSASLSHNTWSMLNTAGLLRNGVENMDGCSHSLQDSSAPFYAGLGSSGLGGFANGNGNLRDARAAAASLDQQRQLLGLMSMEQSRLHDFAKREICSPADFSARLGLNLGGRTYFSADDSSLARFGKRHRPNSPGAQGPVCQAEGCKADLSVAKHYHRRHKVCDFHSKSATVIIAGQTQRFCQQCSRFHVLYEFDEGKRSCRKRLADHNRRRRKQQPTSTATSGSSTADSAAQKIEWEKNSSSNVNGNGVQAKAMDKPESHALLSGMNLTSSLPLMMQNGKRQIPALPGIHEKESIQQFLKQGCTSPNLSLSTLGGGITGVTTQRQSSTHGFEELDITVPWLRPVGSRSSNLMENVARSSMNAISDQSNLQGQFLELGGSSSSMQALSQSFQNLLPLQPNSKDPIGNSNHWMMKTINRQGSESFLDFASKSLSSSGKPQNHEVLSLLEGGTAREVQNSDSHCQQNVLLEFMQQQLPSAASLNEVSDGNSVTGNQQDIKFHSLQALRSFNQSVYSTENIL